MKSSCDWYLPSLEMLEVYVCLSIEFRFKDLIRHYFPLQFIPISSEFCLHLEVGCCKLLTCPLCLVFSNSCWQMAVPCEHSLLFVLNNKAAAAYIVCQKLLKWVEKDLCGFFFCSLVCLTFSDVQLLIHFFVSFVL